MSLLSHQSAINSDKNFWLSATGGGAIVYDTPISFDETVTGSLIGEIKGALSTLCIQSPLSVSYSQNNQEANPTTIINTDATAQNGYPGVYTSTIMYAGAGLGTGGLSASALLMNHRDASDNVVDLYRFYMPLNDMSYGSSIGFLNYSSKDSFAYNAVTSPVYNINPYSSPEPTITIPTYTLSTTSVNVDSALISSVNGTQMVSNATLINLPKPTFNSPATIPQAVTTVASVTPIPALVPGGIYSYDCSVSLSAIVANNVGSAPTYPYNVNFGVRIGGIDGTFDYPYTVSLPSAGGIGNGSVEFNLSGMVQAGTQAQTFEVVAFQQQVGTTATLTFVVGNDDRLYLQRVG